MTFFEYLFYPFGSQMPARFYNGTDYRYGFNGKENDKDINEGAMDFGARVYDNRLGRWFSMDPLKHNYPFVSPYNYCLNTPIQALDPDGEKVLFVNGYYNTGKLEKTAGAYGKRDYWGSKLVSRAEKYFGDYKSQFIDGRGKWNSNGAERLTDGYEWAKANYESLIQGVINDQGVQTETFKVVSHSMGAAYAEGIIKYLQEKGLIVEKTVHLSPADPSDFTASPNTETLQLNYENDIVLAYKNFGECDDKISGVDSYGNVSTDEWFGEDYSNSHARTKFSASTFDALEDLESMKFHFQYSYSPTGRKMDNVGLFKYSGTKFGTKFNRVFKGAKSFKIQNTKVATSKIRSKF